MAVSEVTVRDVYVTLYGGLDKSKLSGKTKLFYRGNIINCSERGAKLAFDAHKDVIFDCECEYENWSCVERAKSRKSF